MRIYSNLKNDKGEKMSAIHEVAREVFAAIVTSGLVLTVGILVQELVIWKHTQRKRRSRR